MMTPGEWIAFAALMLTVVSGGVSAAAWIIWQLATVKADVQQLKELVASMVPDLQRGQSAKRLWGV